MFNKPISKIGKVCANIIKLLFNGQGRLFAIISSCCLLLSCYIVNNFPIFTGESMFQYICYQKICKFLGIHKEVDYGNVVFFNTSYDNAIIPTYDYHNTDIPEPIGNETITDRCKLFKLLKLLHASKSYKFIILDIGFDKKDVSQCDDSLFNQINQMDLIVFGNHENLNLTNKLAGKDRDALVSYYITKSNTNFGRYEYSEDDKRSIPLFVYEHLHPNKKMIRYGYSRFSLFFMDGSLCQNTNFLTFDDFLTENDTAQEQTKLSNNYVSFSDDIYNIGQYLYKPEATFHEQINEIDRLTKDKIVIIGDLTNDIHDTYMGEKPGPLIIARALQTLEEGKNKVLLGQAIFWFIVFYLLSYLIYTQKNLSNYFPLIKAKLHLFVRFILSLVSYTIVLIVCSFIEYAVYDHVYSMVIPLLYFALLKIYVQYNHLRNYET